MCIFCDENRKLTFTSSPKITRAAKAVKDGDPGTAG